MDRPDSYRAALHLAAIVESSDDAIVSKDLNGIIRSWNRAAEQMFGYSADEVIGKSITIIIPHDRLNEEAHVLSMIKAGQPVEHFETLRRRKDGSMVPISLTISPIRDVDGRIIGASKIARDISDRRRAEAALAEAEAGQADLQQRLVALVAASGKLFSSLRIEDVVPAIVALAETLIPADGYAVWRLDASHGWHVVGSAGVSEQFTGRVVRSHSGRPATAVPFSDPLAVESVHQSPLLGEQSEAYRAEGIESMLAAPLTIAERGTGTLVFYYRSHHASSQVEIQTARALSNLAAAAIATAELYDEQRRMREAAERANQQAAFLAEASAALAGSLDYDATLRTLAKLAVPQIADWCSVDIVDEQGTAQRIAVAHVDPTRVELARSFQKRYPDDPARVGSIAHVIATGRPVVVPSLSDEMLVSAARGDDHLQALRELAIRSYVSVPIAAHGRIFGALTFVSAESGRQYSDGDLRFAQDVAYRAALAIENARAHQQANAANRAKDEFLATLSHELRTPLNAVLGWIRMLRSGTLGSDKVARAFEVIERNAAAQLDLVEDLLDLSRIITGKFRLDVATVDVGEVIHAAIEAIHPAASAKNIELAIDIDPSCCFALADRTRLQQAVWNLLSNAIKFTPRGGRVSVSMGQLDDSQIEIIVADTGEGIPADVLPYVFDRFRQGESGTTRTHTGLGLGLAIVRHIVELHGGRVEASSGGPNRGATFRLLIPVRAESRAIADAGEFRAPRRRPSAMLSGLRALVVDDDRDARDLVTEVLRSRGMEVVTAASAAEGLAALDRQVPDVLLSDIAMPELDGFELIRRVRERPAHRGGAVPAVALTAYARPEDSARSLSSGFQVHLAKPVDMEHLVSTVATLAGR